MDRGFLRPSSFSGLRCKVLPLLPLPQLSTAADSVSDTADALANCSAHAGTDAPTHPEPDDDTEAAAGGEGDEADLGKANKRKPANDGGKAGKRAA